MNLIPYKIGITLTAEYAIIKDEINVSSNFIYSFSIHKLGADSQNFLGKFVRFFVILGLKNLILLWFKALFEADINKSQC